MNCTLNNVSIRHITSILPSLKKDNFTNPYFDEKEIKKIIKTTGVKTRYELARDKECDETLLDLYVESGLDTLQKLDWSKDSIDGVIVVSQQHEYKLPATACILQDRLGLHKECLAYDVAMGCSGYVYGLYVAMSHIAASGGEVKRILLFVGDAPSNVTYHKNKSIAMLFGDAGSCTAIEYNPNAKQSYFRFKTLGEGYKAIILPYGGLKQPLDSKSFDEFIDEDGNVNIPSCSLIKGIEVFDFTIEEVPSNIEAILHFAKLQSNDIERYYLHQANKMINEYLINKMQVASKSPINIDKFGNTSCVSIPLLLCHNPHNHIAESRSLFAGFGVGLSVAIAILQDLDFSTNILYHTKEK
ncbi:3-ketoacyl-ACP synthase [Helicobacter didelphidarum]|uniref:3-ketoacyl-ACP synthase n=1 Tax=Helicobacter didelphidarum TaxID=2040648 RepID=A0A3D8IMN3_9HELI|nr:3-oxoacyl-[acyl-carrier-protein] synthase III C-terminal domain-containing protein [Helicobacter didelphidarum]RDU66509.1 3-ketoacyl-ACP synthase [Helicobacter didelphidarum]